MLFAQTSCGAGLLNGPSIFEAPSNGGLSYAKPLTPLSYGKGFSIVSNEMVSSCVVALLFLSTPFAICFAVMAVIVGSVYGFIRRALVHIFKEIEEGVPALTDLDAPAAVMREGRIFLVVTALKNSGPYSICSRINQAMFECAPMSSLASARTNIAVAKVSRDHLLCSARTQTQPPSGVSAILGDAAHRSKLSELFSWNQSFAHRGLV